MKNGLFIVIEGPNGAGKTTVINSVCDGLELDQIQFVRTKEPTTSDLGKYIRNTQNVYSKEVLACLVAANRYEHLDTIIRPNIQLGKVVLSDRYLPSSLVYQMMDGLDSSFIESLNQRILVPSLTIFLMADESVITKRIKERDQTTRFEQNQVNEIQFYKDAIVLLKERGWNILSLDSGILEVHQLTEIIVKVIKENLLRDTV